MGSNFSGDGGPHPGGPKKAMAAGVGGEPTSSDEIVNEGTGLAVTPDSKEATEDEA